MRLRLPDGKRVTLNKDITIEEKLIIVAELTEEWLEYADTGWDRNNVKFFLDNLSSYLVWHKEEEDAYTEDKEVISLRKTEEMIGRRRSRSVPISSLTRNQRTDIGIEEGDYYG